MLKGRIALGFAAVLCAAPALAQVYVAPRVNRDGSVTQGHFRTAPNSTTLDNWSTRGNVNPYTGRAGTNAPTYSPPRFNTPSLNSSYKPLRPYKSPY